jgi:YD repeat-containing protein
MSPAAARRGRLGASLRYRRNLTWSLYSYHPNNTVLAATDTYRGFVHQFGYDTANRLTSATGYTWGNTSYAYTANSALGGVTTGYLPETYVYDPPSTAHKLSSITWRGGSMSMTYDQAGQRCTTYRSGQPSAASSPGYTRSFTWYGDGALASITNQMGRDPITVLYNTDEDGKRWRWAKLGSRGEVMSSSLYLDDRAEVEDGWRLYEHLALPNMRIQLQPLYGYHRVHFGDMTDTSAVIDVIGNEQVKKTYRPYGQEIVVLGGGSFPFGFQSKRRETGFDMIEGAIRNPLEIIGNLANLARKEGAHTLQIRARIANERLYDVLKKRYGMVSEGGEDLITIKLKQ